MRCPVCQQYTPDSWRALVAIQDGGGYKHGLTVEPGGSYQVNSEVTLEYMYCANDECRQLVIRAREELHLPRHAVADPEMLQKRWLVRPQAANRSVDRLVPEPFPQATRNIRLNCVKTFITSVR
jgi:hypothetical protein